MENPWHFEQFVVGQIFRSPPFPMERERMIAFACEFDPQPQHIDDDAASASKFGELVASGWHTAAVSMRLFIAGALPPIAGGSQGMGIEGLTWPHPVRPGDTLTVEAEIVAARASRSRPGHGVLTIRATTTNGAGEIVQTATHAMLVPTTPSGAINS